MHSAYELARAEGIDRTALPGVALAEFLLVACLLPWIDADLIREWQNVVVAFDASPSYGFGVSVADAPPDLLRAFAREATLPNTHVRLHRDGVYVDEEAESLVVDARVGCRLQKLLLLLLYQPRHHICRMRARSRQVPSSLR